MNYGPQIVEAGDGCQWCGRTDRPRQRHEVFHGPFRQKSKAMGCWVLICDECHRKLHQQDNSIDRALKVWMQTNAMAHYGWNIDQFRAEFGKNYLEQEGLEW